MFKFVAIAAVLLVAAVSAQYYQDGGELGSYGGEHIKDDYKKDDYEDAYPKYKYEYGVKDDHTGDHKSQWEIRDGDAVKGGYTLHEADGTERVVEYTSDKLHGFQAVVKRVGHAHHPTEAAHHGHQQAEW